MLEYALYYLEFDPIIGPRIERFQTSNGINCPEKINPIKKSNTSIGPLPKCANKTNSGPINCSKFFFPLETDKLSKIICNNSFPESFKQLTPSEPHFYTFTFNYGRFTKSISDNYFCYTIYMNVPDSERKRNFHQFSYVIVTKLNNPNIFKKLLISAINSFRYSYKKETDENSFEKRITLCTYEIFDVLFSFLKQWKQLISIEINNDDGEIIDLPLIDGSVSIKLSKVDSQKTEICEIKRANSTSLFEALDLDKIKILDGSKHIFDNNNNISTGGLFNETLKLIWESSLFNKKIIVVGSTPSEASEAVFAISSLFQNIKSFIVPYISATDERFMQLFKEDDIKNHFPVIIGVSNPISEFLVSNNRSFFDFTYYVGFNDKVGFKELMLNTKLGYFADKNTKGIQFIDNSTILKKIESYSSKFLNAFDQFFVEMSKNDFTSLFLGKINIILLSRELYNNKIQISNYMRHKINKFIQESKQKDNIYDIFAKNLINTQLFIKERKQFLFFSKISHNFLVNDSFVQNIIFKNRKEFEKNILSFGSDDESRKSTAKNILKIYFYALKNSFDDDNKLKLKMILRTIANSLNLN